ncbi:DUF4302 domain-containing protein [Porphyromonas levii]|uniref:DUF4302 domain-containing protein n=1 Tax=Porphyromonas levii TaxID=28114 RepID=A0A4Y8WPE0_9PORP|nr:DUF4302 domain-containing protein [Porphyromonas levii]MBR8702583.1 hypothetical protein [Porphyromonas levii]MBR8712485.1 hypothetical protein [Porphyromonas levii]MBR8714477.1 hypothetical protein [Porphyromonas levii]MBR8727018.1 hypothetical protein [Porphyromonas levii]MBR8730114.1 hypothetical protein [Porphyromonas levii]
MRYKINIVSVWLGAFCLLGSCTQQSVFIETPAERSAKSISDLRSELVEAPYGWKVTYFSNTDSLLFANPLEKFTKKDYSQDYGVGGHYFWMKFDPEGRVEMRSDFDSKSATTSSVCAYELKQVSGVQLSFTSYGYLHQLVNDLYQASSDFLFRFKDIDDRLVFETPMYSTKSKTFIRFERVTSPEEMTHAVEKSVENRNCFEGMRYPQLRIHKGDREYFGSNYIIAQESNFKKWLKQSKDRRYRVFIYNASLVDVQIELTGLGSGYTGTDRGLSFRPGIRYSKNEVFCDFERVGDHFVCELVRMYHPKTRSWRYVSKHLAPDGEPTGMIAEIYDNKRD